MMGPRDRRRRQPSLQLWQLQTKALLVPVTVLGHSGIILRFRAAPEWEGKSITRLERMAKTRRWNLTKCD